MMLLAVLAAAHAATVCGAATTQADLNACATADYARADAGLNAQWRAALARVRAEGGGPKLLAAQRAWLAFRDAECEAEEAGSTGGSMHGMAVVQCRTALTRERTRHLADLTKEH